MAKIKRKSADFDEVISDSFSRNLGAKELPLKGRVFMMSIIAITFIAFLILGRLFVIGGFEHAYYKSLASDNVNQEIITLAPRGIIFDRFDKELVKNEAIFNVRLQITDMVKNAEKDAVLNASSNTLGLLKEDLLKLILETDLEKHPDIVIKRDITTKEALDIKSLGIESLYVENGYKRQYKSDSLSHITGFVGWSDSDKEFKGRDGLEAYYDDTLHGQNGKKVVYQDALGETKGAEILSDPVQGNELKTTIDYDFQEYMHGRLLSGLQDLGRTSGAALAIDPRNGEVLALVSLPTFDANKIGDYLEGTDRPLFNRVVSGAYNPGSTIKPVDATAILKEKVVSPDYQIFSPGFIEIPNPYFPDKPSRFLDWRPQGWVDIYSALARSSNVYFYETVGGFEGLKGLGIERLRIYWDKFGFGKPTGIDLPGEVAGFLPSPEEKEKRTGSPWRVGDTYNVAIGQGDISVNLLQLLDAISAVATGGKVYTPHLKMGESNILFDISDMSPELAKVKIGMEDGVNKSYGTSFSLKDLPFKVAAKTGSAQISNNTKTNALFVGFAPSDNPQIAILILVEDAREGSLNAIPVAKDVLKWYYENRLKK